MPIAKQATSAHRLVPPLAQHSEAAHRPRPGLKLMSPLDAGQDMPTAPPRAQLYISPSAGASRSNLASSAMAPGLRLDAPDEAVNAFVERQSAIPYIAAVKRRAERGDAILIIPGHTQGSGFDDGLAYALPASVARYDLAQTPELGNLLWRQGPIGEAQTLAAQAFGALDSHFILSGGTGATKAMVDAASREGQTVILPRNAHSSAYLGLVASGAAPFYVVPDIDAASGIALPLTALQVQNALAQASHVSAVMVVSPTVTGLAADVAAIAAVTRAHNVALLVDQAWGAHFGFHPRLPESAVTLGADLVAMSMHKKLDSSTQTALLHRGTQRVQASRLHQAVERVSSTSPNSLLLMSMDMARRRAACLGYHLLDTAIAMCDAARLSLSRIDGVEVLLPTTLGEDQAHRSDPTTVIFSHVAYTTGMQLANAIQAHGVQVILTEGRFVVALFSLSAPGNYGARLASAMQAVSGAKPANGTARSRSPEPSLALPQAVRTPRQASQSDAEQCLLRDALGRISSETLMAYPPAVPLVCAGEVINQDVLDVVAYRLGHGACVLGVDDKGLINVLPQT